MRFFIKMSVSLLCWSASVIAAGQNASVALVTLQVKEKRIPDILSAISRQTGVDFSYETSTVENLPPVSFQAVQEPLDPCLQRLFKNLPVDFQVINRTVILKKTNRRITLSGFVRDAESTEYLIGASLYDPVRRTGTTTNERGFFSLTLPVGPLQLEISYVGYRKETIHLPSLYQDSVLNLSLTSGKALHEVVVTGNGTRNLLLDTRMGSLTFTQEMLKTIPSLMGETDIIKALQTQPGVSAGTEGLANLYVRGGNGDENLYLVDGNPLYQVNHLGGLFSAFNAEAVKDAEFYKSAFPARYGGRLSSIVNIHTKDGNMREYHGSATLGLTSGNLNFEGPLIRNKTSFNLSLRRTWLDAVSAPALAILNRLKRNQGTKTKGRYAFHDLNAKINHHFNSRSQGYLTLYYGEDFLKGGTENYATGEDTPFKKEDTSRLRWGNIMAAAGWTYVFSHKLFGTVASSYTRYRSSLQRISFSSSGVTDGPDYTENSEKTRTENGIDDTGFRMSFDYRPVASHQIHFGSHYLWHRFRPEYLFTAIRIDDSYNDLIHDNERVTAHEWGLYAEDDWTVSPFLRINAGFRLNFYSISSKKYVNPEPRLSARLLLRQNLSLKLSYTRMSQYVHQICESYMSLPTDTWMPIDKKLKPLISDQWSAGLYYHPRPGWSVAAEGYYKQMKNILDYKDGYHFLPSLTGWEEKLAMGKGRSYGMEITVRKQTGQVTGWIGYGLMWADRQFREINGGKRFPAKFDNRHKLDLVANWKINPTVELTGSWVYTTGNRITLALENYQSLGQSGKPGHSTPLPAYPPEEGLGYYAGRNNLRLPAYHRLDLGVNFYRTYAKGRSGIWNISIYNAYSRMNPIVIKKRIWLLSSGRPLTTDCYFETLGIIPIIPSVSYTYKF